MTVMMIMTTMTVMVYYYVLAFLLFMYACLHGSWYLNYIDNTIAVVAADGRNQLTVSASHSRISNSWLG